ncbi:DEAD/DEAH box helicase [Streptomyces bobili]
MTWFEDDHWDEIGLGKSRSGELSNTPRSLYGNDAPWVRRWSCYAEAMAKVIAYKGEPDELLTELGDPSLRIYRELIDEAYLPEGGEIAVGRWLLNDVIMPALTLLHEQVNEQGSKLFGQEPPDRRADSREAVEAWYFAVTTSGRTKERLASLWAQKTRTPERPANPTDAPNTMRSRMWARGLGAPGAFTPGAAPGWRELTRALDKQTERYQRPVAGAGIAEIDRLLPPELANRIREGEEELRVRREQAHYGVEELKNLGIDEHGRTDLMANAIPKLRSCMERRQSMLLLGATSSGKSRIGRIAAAHAVKEGGRAIFLMPTKALVNQAVREWRDFLNGTVYQERWRILPGSRDHAQNDELIARGLFEVAVLIPEKLAGLVAGGMRLDGVSVIIVDELQNLADPERGPRLEMLITAIRTEYTMPMIGLSATLTPSAVNNVMLWLDIAEDSVIKASRRPVPLSMLVCDDRKVRWVSHEETEPPRLDLGAVLKDWDADADLRGRLGLVRSYRRALALAVTLLKDEGRHIKSVLCFVGSREDAQRLTDVAQAVLALDPAMNRVDPERGVYGGRFSALDDQDRHRLGREFSRFPATTLRDSVERSLTTGVGYHTARLEQPLRNVIETAFGLGVIRLLFATDTLKLGINLPADAVVNGALTSPMGGGMNRVLDRDTVAQRLGRAGRLNLGTSPRGYGYLVVPEEPPNQEGVHMEPMELRELASRVPALGETEPELDQALRALCDVEAVYRHYLQEYSMPGAAIDSRVDEEWFASELLHWAVRRGSPFDEDELRARTDLLYSKSLRQVTGAGPPDYEAVLQLMLEHELIGADIHDPRHRRLVVTGLGRAVSTSGLPFSDATVVDLLTRAARDGAGDLTLLWLAAKSEHVQRATAWISVISREGEESVTARQKEGVLALASVFAASPNQRAQYAARLRNSEFLADLPATDLVGSGVHAQELRQLLAGPAADPGTEGITALLRSCVLMLWIVGCPLSRLEPAIEKNLAVPWRNGKPRTVVIHAADVRSLGENTSYLFDAARELAGVRPQGTVFRRFETLGESVEYGVPSALGPLARLQLAATHRERIVELVPSLRNGRLDSFDSVADIVDRYMTTRPMAASWTAKQRKKVEQLVLTDEEREQIRAQLERMEGQRRRVARLTGDFQDVRIPGAGGETMLDAYDRLRRPNQADVVKDVAMILRRFGVDAEEEAQSGMLTLSSRVTNSTRTARMAVHSEIFKVADLAQIRGQADIVLACNGATTGVRNSHLYAASNPVVVQPAILLEAIAHLRALEEAQAPAGETPEDLDDWLFAQSDPVTTTEDLDWLIADPDEANANENTISTGDAPEDDYAALGDRLLRLLTAAPPILGRSELLRLVAGLIVAAPPEIDPAEETAASESEAAR